MSFRFTVVADAVVERVFARHVGAARFAYNHCLATVKTALAARATDRRIEVPWSGFSLINHFNTWKRSADAGRTWAVDPTGQATLVDTGLPWRGQVSAQVCEEAAGPDAREGRCCMTHQVYEQASTDGRNGTR